METPQKDPATGQTAEPTALEQTMPNAQSSMPAQDSGLKTQDNKKSKKKLFLILFIFGVIVLLIVGAAYLLLSDSKDEEPEPEPTPVAQACDYEGITYEDGETFEASDGCNSCICEDGVVSCTEIDCKEGIEETAESQSNELSTNTALKECNNSDISIRTQIPEEWPCSSDSENLIIKTDDFEILITTLGFGPYCNVGLGGEDKCTSEAFHSSTILQTNLVGYDGEIKEVIGSIKKDSVFGPGVLITFPEGTTKLDGEIEQNIKDFLDSIKY